MWNIKLLLLLLYNNVKVSTMASVSPKGEVSGLLLYQLTSSAKDLVWSQDDYLDLLLIGKYFFDS